MERDSEREMIWRARQKERWYGERDRKQKGTVSFSILQAPARHMIHSFIHIIHSFYASYEGMNDMTASMLGCCCHAQ